MARKNKIKKPQKPLDYIDKIVIQISCRIRNPSANDQAARTGGAADRNFTRLLETRMLDTSLNQSTEIRTASSQENKPAWPIETSAETTTLSHGS